MRRGAVGPGLLLSAVVLAGPALAQQPAGGNFVVNATSSVDQFDSAVAVVPDGRFVITWLDYEYLIHVQRFGRAGERQGSELIVNLDREPTDYPRVATRSNGDFVVAWDRPRQGEVRAQRFSARGERQGEELTIPTSLQMNPDVAFDPRGRFILAWMDGAPPRVDIRAQRYEADGRPLGAHFQVNADTTGYHFDPRLAAAPAGGFAVVWGTNPGDGSITSANGQRFDADGQSLGATFQVNTYTTGAQLFPDVAYAPDGSFVVAFSSSPHPVDDHDLDTFIRRYRASGEPIGEEVRVSTYNTGQQGFPTIAFDPAGNFVVSWSDSDEYYGPDLPGVHAQRFGPDGTPRSADFLVNTYTTGRQQSAIAKAVATDAAGNFVVTWSGRTPQGGAHLSVFAQRYGGLFPDALEVDAAGNRVWEPGETVEVHPRWLNANGAAQTFAGTLSRLSGPAGATYAITDAAGDYGTVANGTAVPCSDCYAVGVNDPARPALHWDASVLESITPDILGQQKSWALHIGRSFGDVPAASPFYRFIETLLHHGVTAGCGGGNYCPGTATTREQMAVFVLLAREGPGYAPPACTTPVFGDVPAASPFCRFIEELARRGVVNGCGGGNYCPLDPVTREQMAVFTLHVLDPTLVPPACGTPVFNDVPAGSPFCRWIEELARRGVVAGCGGGAYCPGQPVTREQMGVFIGATFGLTLYGP